MIDLTFIWAMLIATAVFLYVVMDGFDLGIVILSPLLPERHDRDVMVNTVAPVWDGNETWLVLGGGGLFAVFPLAYATILPALYMPLILMLLALVFRGVAFEFRHVSRSKTWWNLSFAAGSTLAAFSQGEILAGLIQGIRVENSAFAGGAFDARDTLRLEAGMNLYGQDMDESINPLEAGLAWTVDLKSERDFIGKAALLAKPPVRKLVGLVLLDRGVLRGHQKVHTAAGEGEITSGTFAPTLEKSLAFARVPNGLQVGDAVQVAVRDKMLAAKVVKYPFARNGKAVCSL